MEFSLDKVTYSSTAIRLDIIEQNTPTEDTITNAKLLWNNVVSKITIPYTINSWYRCFKLNKAVGGSATSDHMIGASIDIDSVDNKNNKAIFTFIKDNIKEFDQLIYQMGDDINPSWVHVSYRKRSNRKQILRAFKENGKRRYKPYV